MYKKMSENFFLQYAIFENLLTGEKIYPQHFFARLSKKRITNTRNWLQNVEWFMNMQQFLNLLVRLFLSLSISFKSGVKKVPTTFFVIVCGKIGGSSRYFRFCWFSSGNEVLLRNILLLHFREATKCIPIFPFSATV